MLSSRVSPSRIRDRGVTCDPSQPGAKVAEGFLSPREISSEFTWTWTLGSGLLIRLRLLLADCISMMISDWLQRVTPRLLLIMQKYRRMTPILNVSVLKTFTKLSHVCECELHQSWKIKKTFLRFMIVTVHTGWIFLSKIPSLHRV